MNLAGFWRRYTAWTLDAVLILLPVVLLFWPLLHAAARTLGADYAAFLRQAGRSLIRAYAEGATPNDLAVSWLGRADMLASFAALQSSTFALVWPLALAFAVLGALYHVGFETSSWQATPGQRALGLRVIAASGLRVDAAGALKRHAAGALSWITLNIGHAMAMGPDRLALHDRVSATRVVQARAKMPLPVWAKGWFAVQAIATVWAVVAFVRMTSAWLEQGFALTG